MIYLVVLLLLLLLSFRYDICGKTIRRDQWYQVVLIIFILIAGLRYRFAVDTIGYLNSFYYNTPYLWEIDLAKLETFRFEPLWVFINSLVKSLGGKFFVVQIIQASIVNILIFKYFKKHISYPFLCVTLFFIMDYHYFCMMIMRNAIAIAICLFANDFFLEKKWKKAILLYTIAFLFHYSTLLIILITPFLMWLRLNKIGVVFLLSMLVVGKITSSYFEDVFALIAVTDGLSDKIDGYLESGLLDRDNVTLNYYIFGLLVPFIYTFLSLYYIKKRRCYDYLLKLEPFVMIGMMLIVLRANIGMLHRFTYLYSVYFIVFYVQVFMDMYKRKRLLTKSVSLVRSFIIFSPFLFVTIYSAVKGSLSYYPYYTIIEKKVDKEREKHYLESRPYLRKLSDNEY